MRNTLLAALAVTVFCTPAFAFGDRTTNNNHARATANAGAVAGAAALNRNDIDVAIRNRTAVRNSVSNYNRSSNANVNSNRAYGGSAYQHQGQGQDQSQRQHNRQGQDQAQSANNEGVTGNVVSIGGDTYEAAAVAPGLAALTGTTCMGSTTASFGNGAISLGAGTTWTDEECQLRANIAVVGQLLELDPRLGDVLLEMVNGLSGVAAARGRLGARAAETAMISTGLDVGLGGASIPHWCDRVTASSSRSDKEACNLL